MTPRDDHDQREPTVSPQALVRDLRALEDADPAVPGLRELLERLQERVRDGGVRAHLARLQARVDEAAAPVV